MPRLDYTGKNVDELLAGPYKEAVAAIKADPSVEAAIAKYKDENEEYGFLIDDLFILRYAISHTDDVATASKAVSSTLEWRHEHQDKLRPFHKIVDDSSKRDVQRDLEELTRTPGILRAWSQHLPGFNDFMVHGAASYHGHTIDGGPVFYARPGLSETKVAEASAPLDVIKNLVVYAKEPAFALCDQITRKTRHLVKCTTVIDVKGIGLSNLPSGNFRKMQSEASVEAELYYPQYSGKVIMVNIPAILRMFMTGFFMMLPASLTDKIIISSPPSKPAPSPKSSSSSSSSSYSAPPMTLDENNNPVPILHHHTTTNTSSHETTFHGIALSNLPSYLGGYCRCGKPRPADGTYVDHDLSIPLSSTSTTATNVGTPYSNGDNIEGWCIDGVSNMQKTRL